MKLYATVNSERVGRPARKGGDETLDIRLSVGNREVYHLRLNEFGMLTLIDDSGFSSSVGWKEYQKHLEWKELCKNLE